MSQRTSNGDYIFHFRGLVWSRVWDRSAGPNSEGFRLLGVFLFFSLIGGSMIMARQESRFYGCFSRVFCHCKPLGYRLCFTILIFSSPAWTFLWRSGSSFFLIDLRLFFIAPTWLRLLSARDSYFWCDDIPKTVCT